MILGSLCSHAILDSKSHQKIPLKPTKRLKLHFDNPLTLGGLWKHPFLRFHCVVRCYSWSKTLLKCENWPSLLVDFGHVSPSPSGRHGVSFWVGILDFSDGSSSCKSVFFFTHSFPSQSQSSYSSHLFLDKFSWWFILSKGRQLCLCVGRWRLRSKASKRMSPAGMLFWTVQTLADASIATFYWKPST